MNMILMSLISALACEPIVGAAQEGLALSPGVELWGVQEIILNNANVPANPFKDVRLHANFTSNGKSVKVAGFYDGGSIWKIRFMPNCEGEWSYKTMSSEPSLDGMTGRFFVAPPSPENHGPIRVAEIFHFSYADGTPYFLLGTTSYNWLNRDNALQELTLSTLRSAPFNKLRFGLFPKWFVFNRVEPTIFPYPRKDSQDFDLERFDLRFFANVEDRIRKLDEMDIQADVILFHPYDKWGFATMDEAHNEAYLRYVVARLSAFKNVWWTMANEYDLMTPRDWDKLVRVVQSNDPYGHPLGNHPIADWYHPKSPFITHVIIQSGNGADISVSLGRTLYDKPVVDDEYGYEGNNTMGWGDLKSNEAVLRHWRITMAGGYASHGDTHVHPGGVQFWGAGGEMHGESSARLGFLKRVMSEMPFQKMIPSPELVVNGNALAQSGQAYLFSFFEVERLLEPRRPTQVRLAGADLFKVELIDPWVMKIFELGYTAPGDQAFNLLMKPSLLRVTAVPVSDGSSESLAKLLDRFAGEPSEPQVANAGLFKSVPVSLSVKLSIAQLSLIPEARLVLEKYLPAAAFNVPARAFTVDGLIAMGMIDKDYVERIPLIDKELKQISVR